MPSRLASFIALAAVTLSAAIAVTVQAGRAGAASLSQLNSRLGATQGQERSLAAGIAILNEQLASLQRQVAFVQAREAAVRVQLARDEARLADVRAAVGRQRALLVVLRGRLAQALRLLRAQLVDRYENGPPTLIQALLDAHGFGQLLTQINFLNRAQQEQQEVIAATRSAKHHAASAERRLVVLQRQVAAATAAAATESLALTGMHALLASRQTALDHLRAARQTALAAARARGARLQRAIRQVQAQQAAAAAAAAAANSAPYGGRALGPSGGWAIPYPIVLCESGGQDLPPNGAGASGYYQIIPSTWRRFGGSGAAAYLAPKSEQDAVASRIWNGGAGWDNWVCAQILGIH
jgi:septal ring factor EnvC (AmiA/AmiB activator)